MSSPYTPNNEYVYLQAFAGAVAGLLGQSTPLTTVSGSYSPTVAIAGAWAAAVDTAWASPDNPDSFELSEIAQFSNDLFEILEPQPEPASTTKATYALTAEALMTVLADAETYLASVDITPPAIRGPANYGSIYGEATTNSQGSGGPTIVALIQTTVKGSGIFRFAATGAAVTVAADASTWIVTIQGGTGAVATTGGTGVTTAKGITPAGGLAEVATAAAGTGIAITSGGGTNEQTLYSETTTIGANASLVDSKACAGIAGNGASGPFALGTNVILAVKYTNSVANRPVGGLVLSLEEI